MDKDKLHVGRWRTDMKHETEAVAARSVVKGYREASRSSRAAYYSRSTKKGSTLAPGSSRIALYRRRTYRRTIAETISGPMRPSRLRDKGICVSPYSFSVAWLTTLAVHMSPATMRDENRHTKVTVLLYQVDLRQEIDMGKLEVEHCPEGKHED